MTWKVDLRPTRHDRVIDLVAAAGVDVSDWANFAGGAAKSATNPNLACSVKSYDVRTGDTGLIRNDSTLSTIDQFEVGPLADGPADRMAVSGFAYVRDAAVRAAALRRAHGRCEYCGEPGFLLMNGNLFLETHHIVPLSENGGDTVANVAAVCANHHREAHHGVSAGAIRERLLAVAAKAGARR